MMTKTDSIQERHFMPAVRLDQIEIDIHNVRKSENRVALEELKASIKKVGLIHPVLITKNKSDEKFQLLVGQRRYYAFKDLALKESKYDTIPAILINNVDETTKMLISFSENISRRQLPYNDTIKICDELYKAYSHYPKSERLNKIAEEVGLSLATVVKYLSYRVIPDKVKNLVDAGKIDRSQAYRLTETFWPNSVKIVNIAEYMVGMTKPEWENILDVGTELPDDSTIQEIIEESKKPTRKVTIKIRMERNVFDKIKDITSKSETKIDVSDFISELIKDYLRGR